MIIRSVVPTLLNNAILVVFGVIVERPAERVLVPLSVPKVLPDAKLLVRPVVALPVWNVNVVASDAPTNAVVTSAMIAWMIDPAGRTAMSVVVPVYGAAVDTPAGVV